MRLVGYLRVSTEEQAESGLGLEAQRASIESHCAARGWTIVAWEEDHISSRRLDRPALQRTLLRVLRDDTDGVIVAKLDRLGRSLHEVSGYFIDATRQGWSVVSITPAVDMTDPYGKAMAHMALVFAELERDMISLRTREALAAKKARGERISRPVEVSGEAQRIVRELWQRGVPQRRIASRLNDEGLPTVNGGPWTRSTVQRMVGRLEAET